MRTLEIKGLSLGDVDPVIGPSGRTLWNIIYADPDHTRTSVWIKPDGSAIVLLTEAELPDGTDVVNIKKGGVKAFDEWLTAIQTHWDQYQPDTVLLKLYGEEE